MTPRIYLCLIILLSACDNPNSIKNIDIDSDENYSTGKQQNLKDSIFFSFLNCVTNSSTTGIYWYNTHAVVMDEDTSGILTTNDHGEIILGNLQDKILIKQFIDSFPEIAGRPEAIESVKIASNDHLIFVCGKDTLIEMLWDIGKNQIHIKSSNDNYFHQDFHKIDFYKLDELLNTIEIKRK